MKKKALSILLTLALCLSLLPSTVLAAESNGLCEHHTEHTAECGYVEGETPCGFVCAQCAGEKSGLPEPEEGTVTVLTDWEWIDEWEIIDPDSGNVLLPFASEDNVAYFEDIVELLPVSILADGEELTLGDWLCPDYPEDGAYEGEYIFETTLPEGYALPNGGSTLTLTVALGDPEGEPAAMLAVTMETPTAKDYTIGGSTVSAYELSTAAHLYWFANQINTTQQDISAVLTADITVNQNVLNASGGLNSGSFEAWTPIGTVDHNFRGKFDGQGHTISGLYLNDSNTSNVGLFGIADGSIYRVGVVDSYFAGNENVGGLCGKALSNRIESCYTTATVSGSSHVGTFCGYSTANINNCYSAGRIDSSYGAFLGSGNDVDYCYALSNVNQDGAKDSDLKYRTIDAFESGEVTYGLTKNQATPSWRQTIGTHTFPQCTTNGDIVYRGKKDGDVYYHNHTDGEASCSYCSTPTFYNNEYQIYTKEHLYWFAEYVNDGHPAANAKVCDNITVDNDWVPIGNETFAFTGKFAYPVGQKTISGIPAASSLFGATGSGAEIARITVTSGSLCATSGGKIVDCHVSGGGMLVSGANSGTVSDSSVASGGTLVKDNSGTVKNSSAPGGTLVQTNTGTITDCHAAGSGATLCANNNAGGTVTDCYASGADSAVLVGANSGTIQMSYAAGGAKLCTTNDSGGKIINCYATGTGSVTLCGSNSGVIANCFAAGGSGTTVGSGGTITNCYALADSTASPIGGTTLTTDSPFASGEVAYRLNQGTEGYPGGVWGQTIGTDSLPVFDGKAVYYKQGGNPEYHNHNGYCSICTITPTYANDKWQITNVDELYWYAQYINETISGITDKTKNAILMNDITVNSNVLNADGTLSDAHTSFTEWTPIGISSSNYDGTFDGNHHTISGLYVNAPGTSCVGFFGYIIGGGTIKNLTIADSYFEGKDKVGGVCGDTSGEVSGCSYSGAVTGTGGGIGGICGQSQGTVSGCTNRGKVTGNNKGGGICGYAFQGTVSGCINYGAVNGSDYVGGICGYALYGEVSGCINYGAVNGTSSYVGGVCGVNSKTVIGCTNTGAVTGSSTSYYVGGVCGENKGTISGCYSIGTVTGTSSVGGVCGVNSGTVSNCYHNSEAYSGNAVGDNSGTVDSVLGKTTKEFASGAVAYLLNGSRSAGTAEASLVWYQNIDIGTPDAAPQFTGGTVYATSEGSPCRGYTNNSNGIKQHKYENYVCIWCDYQDTIPVTVSGIKANNKEYDGTITATLDFSGVTLNGVEANDNVTVTATGTFGDKNVGENKTVTITGLTLTGDDANKYRLADSGQQTEVAASITKKSVNATVTVAGKVYDGTDAATVSAVVTEGIEAGDSITINGLTGTFGNVNAGTNIPVTVNADNKSISGTGSGNYDVIIPTTATGTINKAQAVITVADSNKQYSKTYDDPSFTLEGITENSDDAAGVQYAVTSGTGVVSVSADSTVTILKAGEATITLSLPESANYLAAQSVDITVLVAQKNGTVTITGDPGKTYDGTAVSLTSDMYHVIGDGDVTVKYKGKGADDSTYTEIAPTNAGDYTVKVTKAAGTNYAEASDTKDFTIAKREVTITGTTVNAAKVYDGSTSAVIAQNGTLSANYDGENLSFTVGTASYDDKNVGTNKPVTFSGFVLSGTASGNYTLTQPASVTANITPKPVTATVTVAGKVYDGTTDAMVSAVVTTTEGLISGDTFTISGLTGTFENVNAGTNKTVTVNATGMTTGGADSDNYTVTIPTTATGTVAKAAAPVLDKISVKQKYTVNTQQSKDIGRAGMPADAGTLTYAKGSTAFGFAVSIIDWDVDSAGKVTYTLSSSKPSVAILKVVITSTNYKDTTVDVVITLTDKDTPTATANDITVTYTGSAVPDNAITGTASVDGTWRFTAAAPVNVADSDNVTVVFTPTDTANYETVEDTIKVTINKATPTGTPAYTAITTGGKTLADAALTVGTITPASGSIAWNLGDSQTVSANTAYNWTYIPADTENYNNLTGSITPYVVSYSGGGSSSGGSSSTTTTTEKNPDGSTTTTVTDKTTGTVTETTKNTDGSTTTVETKKDGTVTETVKSADGTTGTVVTDSSGEVTEVKASVSSAAVTEAAKTGDAVTLPVEVPAAKTTEAAPAVDVTVPKSAGSVKVEIPVEQVTPGTVAVIVHADGTEEIVSTSIPTETGVVLTLDGSATVKVIDNVKVFEDIHSVNHWAEDAVDFVVARGMFAGTSETTFSPNSYMTRAMLMTVLARFDGEDTSGGSVWYEKGMEWAKANGVSDGSNPDAPITREQLATMLWRYAGSPTSSHSLDGYTDADEISGYALEAMRWANENGIINGYGNGLLGVKDNATRAQVAQMLMNFVKCLNQ